MASNSASGLLFCLFIMFIRNQAGFKHFNNFKLVNKKNVRKIFNFSLLDDLGEGLGNGALLWIGY